MSFNTPFYDFFDAITNEVNSFNRLLDNSGYREPESSSPGAQRKGANNKQVTKPKNANQIAAPRAAPLTALDNWFDNDWSLLPRDFGANLVPPVDILDHDTNYELTITVPGVKDKKSINLEYHKEKNQIVVTGEIPSSFNESTKDKVKVQERYSGKFKRVISLPEYPGIDADNIKADYSGGVLTLTVPKLKPLDDGKNAVRKIEISSEDTLNTK